MDTFLRYHRLDNIILTIGLMLYLNGRILNINELPQIFNYKMKPVVIQ